MIYGLIKNEICVSTMESANQKNAQKQAETLGCDAVELEDGYGVGSKYAEGTWINLLKPESESTELTIEERLELIEKVLDDLIMGS